ncbi:hypothetical protein [Cupriavidus necator]
MQFVADLYKDWVFAYRITVSRYPALPLHFIGTTLFVALVAGLSTLVPYLLRQATNALSMDAAHRAAGSAVLLAGAYGLAWTAAHAFEWLKLMLSAAVLARCGAAFHHVIFARLIRVDYTRLSEQDPGKLVSGIARSRDAFSAIARPRTRSPDLCPRPSARANAGRDHASSCVAAVGRSRIPRRKRRRASVPLRR